LALKNPDLNYGIKNRNSLKPLCCGAGLFLFCFGAFVISPNRFYLDFLVIDWKAAVIMLSADMVMKETARRMWWRPASGGRSSFS